MANGRPVVMSKHEKAAKACFRFRNVKRWMSFIEAHPAVEALYKEHLAPKDSGAASSTVRTLALSHLCASETQCSRESGDRKCASGVRR